MTNNNTEGGKYNSGNSGESTKQGGQGGQKKQDQQSEPAVEGGTTKEPKPGE